MDLKEQIINDIKRLMAGGAKLGDLESELAS